MNIFDFNDYKQYIIARIRAMPKHGHGQFLKIAKFLNMHTTMVSQVFRGEAHLSPEQACKLCEYFGFSDLEKDYFIMLVQLERAGSEALRIYHRKKLAQLREQAQNLSKRLVYDKVLSEQDQSHFYSNWYYSGIRLASSIPGYQNIDAIAERLDLPKALVNRVITFLLSVGLCEEKDGKIMVGPSRTYIDRDSPWVTKHHVNWRLKLMQQFDLIREEELVYTHPMTISEKDFITVREEIVKLVEKTRKILDQSSPENLCCLNIDWLKVK